jgi:hypothetical protein
MLARGNLPDDSAALLATTRNPEAVQRVEVPK